VQEAGAQRLSLTRLQAWEALGYGMFIHLLTRAALSQNLPQILKRHAESPF